MYSYTYDPTTGGLLLNTTPTNLSKEPRPVYAPELDLLGFDKFWTYDKQTERPYLWAEANYYYYRGTLVAKLKGGSVFTAPEILLQYHDDGTPVTPEPGNAPLRPVDLDALVRANRERLDAKPELQRDDEVPELVNQDRQREQQHTDNDVKNCDKNFH